MPLRIAQRHAVPEVCPRGAAKGEDMFESAVITYGSPKKRVWATIAGMTGQAVLIGIALLAPLMWPQVIPKVAWVVTVAPPPVPPPPPPPGNPRPQVVPVARKTRGLYQPVSIPQRVAMNFVDPPEMAAAPDGIRGGVPGGIPNGVPTGLPSSFFNDIARPPVKPPDAPPRQAPNAAPPKTPPQPPRISVIEMARPIHRVEPIYPRLAITARIQGTVRLMGVLGVDGRIRELKVLSGPPLLVNAAVDAVKQWIYAPTLLNGQAVEVQAPIEVNFILNH